jgi:hypothetical protein
LAICLLATGCGAAFTVAIMRFALDNPGPASLEGQDLIAWRETDLRAKRTEIVGGPLQPDPWPEVEVKRPGGTED